jgi:isoamylase
MPMLLMGDEVRRTQRGNNNAYCQDNETSWFDWTLVTKHADVHRFVRLLNRRRLLRGRQAEYQHVSLDQLLREAHRAWHGVKLHQPDWSDSSHSLAFTAEIRRTRLLVHFLLNAYGEPLEFELPSPSDGATGAWHRWIDTSLDSPDDIVLWQTAPPVPSSTYRADAHSVVVLLAHDGSDGREAH